jgi:hypothetical protein
MVTRCCSGWGVALATLAIAVPATAGQTQPTTPKAAPATKTSSPNGGGAAAGKKFVPKRLPWGDPDISGNFTTKDEANTPFERPDEFAGRRIEDVTQNELAAAIKARQRQALADAPYPGGGSRALGVAIAVPIHWFDNLDAENSRPWFVTDPPDGKVPPITDEARKRAADIAAARRDRGTADSYTDRSPGDRCIAWSIGLARVIPIIYGNSVQILQSKDYVAIRYEMVHETRIIPIQGRAAARSHNTSTVVSYYGDATARWEGDTLVVDTTNFNGQIDQTSYNCCGGATENLKIIERFRMVDANTIDYRYTVDDPSTFTRPWTASVPMKRAPGPIYEYACHEANYSVSGILRGARARDTDRPAKATGSGSK